MTITPNAVPAFTPESVDLLLSSLGIQDAASQVAVQAGYDVLAQFMSTFNSRDASSWAQTLNFPHVRLTAGQVQLWQTATDYAATNNLEDFAATGWAYTRWDWIKPIQAGPDKAHFALQFTRYNSAHQPISSYQALYVVTLQDGHWGVQSRSSYAGIAINGAAF